VNGEPIIEWTSDIVLKEGNTVIMKVDMDKK
jgi:hypothetical protein